MSNGDGLHSLLGAFAKLQKATIIFVMSVRLSAWNNSAPTGRIFMKFDTSVVFENVSRKLKFYENRTMITGTLHEEQYIYLIISRSFLLRVSMFQTKVVEEIKNTHFCVQYLFISNFVPFMT